MEEWHQTASGKLDDGLMRIYCGEYRQLKKINVDLNITITHYRFIPLSYRDENADCFYFMEIRAMQIIG